MKTLALTPSANEKMLVNGIVENNKMKKYIPDLLNLSTEM